jgi:hypothetical protein
VPTTTPAPSAAKRQQRSVINATTVNVKIPGEALTLLRLEAKIGPYPLLLAVARVIEWGEPRVGGGMVVRLPADDVEVILDALSTLADRMDASGVRDAVILARTLRTRTEQLIKKIEGQDWYVAGPRPDGYRLIRKAI